MATPIQCPACRVRIAPRPGLTKCPGCGARLKKPVRRDDEDDGPARKKKRKKKSQSGPNYALFAAIGGGVVIIGVLVWLVIQALPGKRPVNEPEHGGPGPVAAQGGPGTPAAPAAPAAPWLAKADPPKAAVHLKDDLTIPIAGQPLFASGEAPFVADLVPVFADGSGPPLAVYDLRTGERAVTGKAIREAQSPGGGIGEYRRVALGPDGKTLAAVTTTSTGAGRKATSTTEAVVYRIGQDKPVARFAVPNHIVWMEFGRDDDQLITVSASAGSAFLASAHDIKQGGRATNLEVARTGNRWRNGFRHPGSLAVSPGRSYLAVAEGRLAELVQLADGKPAARFDLPGEADSVAFSPDGRELTVHSTTPGPKKSTAPAQHQWTTFSLETGKQVAMNQVAGGPAVGRLLAAGPKPGLAVHADREHVTVTDTKIGAAVCTSPGPAVRCFDGDRLLGYDAQAKKVTVRRIDPEQLEAGIQELARVFGPRPAADEVSRAGLPVPTAPTAWAVPVDPVPETPPLASRYTVSGGAEFVMPRPGSTALAALAVKLILTPRDRYALEWQRVDLAAGKAEPAIELWPSMLPPGQVPPPAGYGSIVADQTATGSRLAVRDPATPARVDVWDQSGKRLTGFLPYGPETPVDALIWTADDRLITVGGGNVTGWEIPGRKAVFELKGYAGAYALSPGRKWIGLQTDADLHIYDTSVGKPLGRLDRANPGRPWQGFAVSRDGTQLAAVDSVRAGSPEQPGVWGITTWDLKTGKNQGAFQAFTPGGTRTPTHVQWLGPRLLLAGGADVIDLDVKVVVATFGLNPALPLPSPDGRYWGARPDHFAASGNQRLAIETSMATGLDEPVRNLPKGADIVFRPGTAVEVSGETGDGGRDTVIRSILTGLLSAEGYPAGAGGWRMVVTAQRSNGSGNLEMTNGQKIPVPTIQGKVQLLDPTGAVAWDGFASGGFDVNHSKYRTGKEDLGPLGGSITHFNFGSKDPGGAMAEEAWDNFINGLKAKSYFPHVIAKVNGKLTPLPLKVPVSAK